MAFTINGPTQWLNDLSAQRGELTAQPQIQEVEDLRQQAVSQAQLPAASPVDGTPSFEASVQLGQQVNWFGGQTPPAAAPSAPVVRTPQAPASPVNWWTGQPEQTWAAPAHVPAQGFAQTIGSPTDWGVGGAPPAAPAAPNGTRIWQTGETPARSATVPGSVATRSASRNPARTVQAADLGEIRGGTPDDFYATAAPYAQLVEQETGIPAKLSLAIAANETGYGQQRYMAGTNNFHGIQDTTGTGAPYVDWRPGPNGEKISYEARQANFETPLEGFRAFARFLQENPRYQGALQRYRETGDVNQLAADIHQAGYAEDPEYTTKITAIMDGMPTVTGVGEMQDADRRPLDERLAVPEGIADGPDWRNRWGDNLTPNQIKETLALGMDWNAAIATCGPAGALALARATGGNMTFGQVMAVAQEMNEWNAGVGMVNGYQGQLRLLRRLGVDAEARPINEQEIAQTVMQGTPVQINATGNGGHYYTAQDYDPQTGRFDFGNSATILKAAGGQRWFRLDELAGLGVGTPSNAIYIRGRVGQ